MADLYAIYHEQGLTGLVPHSLNEHSHGYRIMVDKIKAGAPLFCVRTQMNTPHILVKDGVYQAMFYTSEELAEQQQEELLAGGYRPEIEELPDGPARNEAFLWLFDHGPTAILIDDSLSIPIRTLATDVPDYDGRPNEEHMLRNRALNGATFYFLQQAAAGYGNMEAERQWAREMLQGEVIIATHNDARQNYPAYTTRVRDKDAVLIYTDWRQVGEDFDTLPAGLIATYGDLYELLTQTPNAVLLLNRPTCHMVIDLTMLDTIKTTAESRGDQGNSASFGLGCGVKKNGFTFGQVSEEEWDKIDPTPDFLK